MGIVYLQHDHTAADSVRISSVTTRSDDSTTSATPHNFREYQGPQDRRRYHVPSRSGIVPAKLERKDFRASLPGHKHDRRLGLRQKKKKKSKADC